jgi:hypothetical protein
MMNLDLMFDRFWKILLVLGASTVGCAQSQAPAQPSLPRPGSEKYWLVVDEFADRAVHLAYAKRFVQLHEPLTNRQCQQYSRIVVDYAHQLAIVKQAGVSPHNGFWNDVRMHSISMIGPPGIPIPFHRTSKYWMTTGSDTGDRDLRRIVLVEIDEASSQLTRRDGNLALLATLGCRTAVQEPNLRAQR